MSHTIKDIGQVMATLEREFPLRRWKAEMSDSRPRPQIPAGTIAQLVVEMVPRMQPSLLAVDQSARLPEIRVHHGSRRQLVASDSTMERSLRGFDLAVLHRVLWELGRCLRRQRELALTLPSGVRATVGMVDGSSWGAELGSVLLVTGDGLDVAVGYRMSPGRGHELQTTRALLAEAVERYGQGWVQYLVVDGLYLTEEDLRRGLRHWGHQLVVKTTEEETLAVLQDAGGLFFAEGGPLEGVEVVEGFDEVRQESYRILGCGGFFWHGLTLKVAYVSEHPVKPRAGRQEKPFWVVTTDEGLSLEDMRFLAHRRWHVENNGFRILNQLVGSKRRLTKQPTVREALLGLWLIGLDLFLFAARRFALRRRPPRWRTMKWTLCWCAQMFARLTLLTYGTSQVT